MAFSKDDYLLEDDFDQYFSDEEVEIVIEVGQIKTNLSQLVQESAWPRSFLLLINCT